MRKPKHAIDAEGRGSGTTPMVMVMMVMAMAMSNVLERVGDRRLVSWGWWKKDGFGDNKTFILSLFRLSGEMDDSG